MFVLNGLRKLRSKLKKMQEPQTFSLQLNANDEDNKKMVALMNRHDEIKNILKLIKEKNSKVTIKNIKYITKIQNVKERLNDLRQENKMLEKYISETKSSEAVENIKRENNSLKMKYKEATCKNIQFNDEKFINLQSTLDSSQEMPINSKVLCNTPSLLLNLNNDFMGFDSMMTSTIKKQIDPQFVSYRSQYHKFRKHSMDAQNTIDSLLNILKQSNESFETEIQNINFVTNQIVNRVKETEQSFTKIMKNDKEIIKNIMRNLMEERRVWKRINLRNADYLSVLELEISSLDNRLQMKRIPTHFAPLNSCSFWDLKKLSIEELYHKWSKIIIQWSPNLEKISK